MMKIEELQAWALKGIENARRTSEAIGGPLELADEDVPFYQAIVEMVEQNSKLKEEVADSLKDYVRQECHVNDTNKTGEYDSCAISSRANAMYRLEALGRFVITYKAGRRVIGHFPQDAPNKEVGDGE